MAKNANYSLVVNLSDADANVITVAQAAGGSTVDKLSLSAGSLLRDLAKGGVMVPAEWADRIEKTLGTVSPQAIVEAVEKSMDKAGEADLVTWSPDPTQVGFYQMLADSAGITLKHQLKTLLDHAYESGWFGMAAPDPFKILLSPEQFRYLQELFGKDIPTGEDVIGKLQAQPEAFHAGADADDFVMGSIK